MKRLFLFPNKFRIIGLIILIPAIAYWIAIDFFDFGFSFLKSDIKGNLILYDSYNPTVAYGMMLIALIFIAFSKVKIEDEFTIQLRFQSFQIATYLSLILFIGLDLFTYSLTYVLYSTMLWYVFLIFFIIIFYTKIYLTNKSAQNEK